MSHFFNALLDKGKVESYVKKTSVEKLGKIWFKKRRDKVQKGKGQS